jgi:uncharacterized membrane protein YbaN (DUF454 family)
MKKTLLQISGHFFLLIGIVGAFLPILPTVPFLLLAAFCYSKSNTKLHSWIINHKYFGPPLIDWEKSGAIGLKAKILATLMISLVLFFRIRTLQVPLFLKITVVTILTLVLVFIWSRPGRKIE